MSTEILVNAMLYETRVAVVEHGVVQEIYIERPRRRGLVGNIYRGRVARVLPGMQAAFIDIGDDRTAFLHAHDIQSISYSTEVENHLSSPGDIRELLTEGEPVLVQVLKDPIGTKGARVTTRVSIPSRFMVYVPDGGGIGVSSRIEDETERERLRELVALVRPDEITGAYIVRTAGEGVAAEALRAEMIYLARLWSVLKTSAHSAPVPALLHEDLPLPLRMMRDLLGEEVSQIRVDSRDMAERMIEFATQFLPEFSGRIRPEKTLRPIFDLYGVEDEITRALARRVDLKSGGNLYFDQTESMTTVDVNTGAYTGARNLEETILKTNLEAAQAIARQLRLRNLGGIIIIDFIDMQKPEHGALVLETLRRELEADRRKTTLTSLSPLGLVEMTRKRTRESLEHVLMHDCPACHGRGAVKTPESVCFDIYRDLTRLANEFNATEYLVLAPPDVIDLLLDEESANLAELSSHVHCPVRLQVEAQYHPDQFDVIPL